MKKILGSLLLIFLHLHATKLHEHNITLSTHTPYVKEGIKVSCIMTQKDISQTMFFECTPKKSKDYYLISLKQEDIPLADTRKKSLFEYILYPLHEGNISVAFDLVVKEATDEELRSSFTIGQYKLVALKTTDTKIDIKPIKLKVKPLPQKVNLIGDYKLDFNIDKQKIDSTQQINISYHIRGEGYPKVKLSLLPKIEKVHYFEDFTDNSTLTNLDLIYTYALISQKSFEIPAINIRCFDPKREKLYNLTTDKKSIEVQKISIDKIVDSKDSYIENKFTWRVLIPYINYILIFFAGFITANIMRKYRKNKKKPNTFEEAIKCTKTTKELLQLLLSKTDPKFEPYIEELYKNRNRSLSKIKKEILNEKS